jgi:hypothetical protein
MGLCFGWHVWHVACGIDQLSCLSVCAPCLCEAMPVNVAASYSATSSETAMAFEYVDRLVPVSTWLLIPPWLVQLGQQQVSRVHTMVWQSGQSGTHNALVADGVASCTSSTTTIMW